MNKREIGSGYEKMAAAYLIESGYELVEMNFRSRQGEIDLIARHGGFLVFVEVKYRADRKMGEPEEAVTPLKQRRIRSTARYYLHIRGFGEDIPCRFDVVSILGCQIRVIQNAF